MKEPVVRVANNAATVISDNQAVETKSATGDGRACVIANPIHTQKMTTNKLFSTKNATFFHFLRISSSIDTTHIIKNQKSKIKN